MRPFCMQTNVVCPALPLIARCSQEENVKQYECVLSRKRSIQKVMSFPLIISSSEGVGCLEWNKPAHLHFCQHEYFFHDTDNSLCVYCIWSYKVVFFTAVLHQRYTFSTLSRCEKYEPQRRSQGQTALKAEITVWKSPPRIAEIWHTTVKHVSDRTVSKCELVDICMAQGALFV